MPHRLLGGAAFLRGKLLQPPAATAPLRGAFGRAGNFSVSPEPPLIEEVDAAMRADGRSFRSYLFYTSGVYTKCKGV